MSVVEISTYKDNPVISFKKDSADPYPFSFGYAKAKIIVENIEAIREFIKQCDEIASAKKVK